MTELKNASRSKTPAPYSVIDRFLIFLAVLIIAYLINAVFWIFLLYSGSSIADSVSAIDAVIIDAETLVPEFTIHSFEFLIPSPIIWDPAVIKSGFILPTPSIKFHVAIPLEEKVATFDRL
jgi:hypothetical protein